MKRGNTVEFKSDGTSRAFNSAKKYLISNGYVVGNICRDSQIGFIRDSPIGFMKSDEHLYVEKWSDLSEEEKFELEGTMYPLDGGGFLNSGVVVEFRNLESAPAGWRKYLKFNEGVL